MPYDPFTDQKGIVSLLVDKFDSQHHRPMTDLETVGFKGAGIYALYYQGSFKHYKKSFKRPIYIGKATPSGGRKNAIDVDVINTTALISRLREHYKSIQQASNLKLEHFYYKKMVVAPLWIYHGESFLIGHHKPLWNLIVDGFGNRDPGSNRAMSSVSKWDTLHPGRKISPKSSKHITENIIQEIESYYSKHWKG